MVPKIFIFLIIVVQVLGYAIQGQWRITTVDSIELSDKHLISANIKDFVFRNRTVRWSFTGTGCQSFKYMMDVEGKNIYLDGQSFFLENPSVQNCTQDKIRIEKILQGLMKKVFTFKIVKSEMAFVNAEGALVIRFERIINNTIDNKALLGVWMTKTLNQNRFSQILQINQKQIIFCQKQGIANYKLTGLNKLEFTNNSTTTCNNKQFARVFTGVLFYIKRNTTLQLYNQNDDLLLSMVYVTDLQGAKKLKEEQAKNAINNPTVDTPMTQMWANQNQKRGAKLIQQNQVYPLQTYFGKWKIDRVSKQQAKAKNIEFVISRDTFIISSECFTYIYHYQLLSATPFKVKRRMLRQMPSSCKSDNKQSIKAGITKMSSLTLSIQQNIINLQIKDQKGNQIFHLEKPNQLGIPQQLPILIQNKISAPPPPVSLVVPNIKVSQNSIQPGKYTVLFLKRRDIPRKIVKIQNNQFTTKLCRQYKFRVQIRKQSKNSIKINSEQTKAGSASCDKQEQKVFLDFFGQSRTFMYQQQDQVIVVKNQNNQQIIIFNKIQ